ncbi:MAG: RNA polymerase sigma factor, partial [Ginsengibacter sp.]
MTAPGNHIPSESDLIKGCINGDAQMQRLLYQRFSAMMYTVCLRYSENTEDANDVLQEGFIKVYKSLPKFRAEG